MRARRLVGLLLIALIAAMGLLAPWIAPHDPIRTGIEPLAFPSSQHLLGTDVLGRDVLSRVIYGARSSLAIGIGAAIVAGLIGVPLGIAAGYFRGRVDLFLVQVIDILIALPGLVVALMFTAMFGATMINLIVILGVVAAPSVARLVRGQALVVREATYVEAAYAAGGSAAWIIGRHVAPNISRTIWAQLSITVSHSIFTSASLSFLGLGVPPPTPDWGSMVREGFEFLSLFPLLSLGPGGAVALTVMAFYLLGSSVE